MARGECVEAELAPLRTQGSVVAAARDRTPWSLDVSGTIDGGRVSLFAVITYEHAITRTVPGSRPSIGDELTLAVLGSDGAAIDTQRFRFTSIGLPAEGAGCEVPCSFEVEPR